jgi:hypothetical protein
MLKVGRETEKQGRALATVGAVHVDLLEDWRRVVTQPYVGGSAIPGTIGMHGVTTSLIPCG